MKSAIIAFILVAAVTVWFIIRTYARDRKSSISDAQQKRQEAVSDLRHQALTGTRETFNLDTVATANTPWGVVMETGFTEGYFSLVALSDGSASIYLSSGGGSIGGRAHETIRRASEAMVAVAAQFQPQATVTKEFPLPKEGQTVFYLLTDAGVFTASAPEEDLGEERHAWAPLFYAGHEVISQYRIIEGSQ